MAAEKFCLANGLIYKITEPRKLSDSEILEIYKNGKIKFIDRYKWEMGKSI